jgi:hypothetical protein
MSAQIINAGVETPDSYEVRIFIPAERLGECDESVLGRIAYDALMATAQPDLKVLDGGLS